MGVDREARGANVVGSKWVFRAKKEGMIAI